MSQSASTRLAVCGTLLLFCSTCQAQNWYSTAAPPAQPPTSATMAVPRFNPPASSPQRYKLPPATYGTPQATFAKPPAYTPPPVVRVPSPVRNTQPTFPRPENFGAVSNARSGENWQGLPQFRVASAGPQAGSDSPPPPVTNEGLVGGYDVTTYNAQTVDGSACGACGSNGQPGTGCISCSGQTSKGPGFFFRYDRLYLSISAPDDNAIGSPNVSGTYTSNGIDYPFQNGMDSGFFRDDFEFAGDRIEFGFLDGGGDINCGGHCGSGWIASILSADQDRAASQSEVMILLDDPLGMLLGFTDTDGDGFDDDLNGDMVYGRDGQDLGTPDGLGGFVPPFDGIPDVAAPQDDNDLFASQPIFSEVNAYSRTKVSGLALSRFHMPKQYAGCGRGGTCVRFLWGVRYLDIDERFSLVGTGSFLDEIRVNADTHNFIIGPEIGVCLERAQGPWSFGGELRFVSGVNFLEANQTGVIGGNAGQPAAQNPVNEPLNVVAATSTNRDERESFSAIAEWRAEVAYSCTHWLSLRAGYTGIFVGEVARGSDISYSLPALGISNDRSDVYINALTLGAELVY